MAKVIGKTAKKHPVVEKYKIEKGIKRVFRRSGIDHPYPFDEMKIGDCFYVPKTDMPPIKASIRIRYCLKAHNKNKGVAQAMAKMLIHLLENNYVNAAEVNARLEQKDKQ